MRTTNWFPTLLAVCFATISGGAADTNIIGWRWLSSTLETNAPQMATNVIALAGSDWHCVALLADRSVRTWGLNNFGQTNVPAVATNVIGVAAGSYHSLAARADGVVSMWGRFPSLLNYVPSAATNVVALGVGRGATHALALKADGTVVDWGNDVTTNVPGAARNLIGVAAGSFHSVAVRADGRVVAWGDNGNAKTNVPASATNIVAVAAGEQNCLAVRADGSLLWWGSISTPPTSATNVAEIGCFKASGAMALKSDGTLIGWGAPVTISATNIMAIGADSWGALAVKAAGPPIFPFPAIPRTVAVGENAYFRLPVVGKLPLSYQWSRYGTNLPGASKAILVVTNVQSSQTGPYTLTVSNVLGAVTSAPMILNVEPMEVTIQPGAQTALGGSNATFAAATVGQGPFSYNWKLEGAFIPGATNSYLTLTNVNLSAAGAYSVAASNLLGGMISPVAGLTVLPFSFSTQPRSQTVLAGSNVTFSVSVSGVGPFSFQWRHGGTNLSGATDSSLLLPNIQPTQAGLYSVAVTNNYGGGISSSANLNVVPLAIVGQPTNVLALLWSPVVFSVTPAGQGPFTYQWRFNGTNLNGENMNTLTLTNVHSRHVGNYSVLVGNSYGLTSSAPASLSIRQVAIWGDAGSGQANFPLGLTNIKAIAAGYYHTLALRNDGTVLAWGFSYDQTNTPPNITNLVTIAAGGFHNLGLKADGTVVGWGSGFYNSIAVPPGLTNVVALAGGEYHSLALKADGTVIAWGAGTTNSGAWPDLGQSIVPVGLSNVVAISARGTFSLALKADGTMVAWGANNAGQTNVPPNATNVLAIAAGYRHGLALQGDGSLVVWGGNDYNQLSSPLGIMNVVAIAAASLNSVAATADNRLVAWNWNDYGQTNVPVGLVNVQAVCGGGLFFAALLAEEVPNHGVGGLSVLISSARLHISFPTTSGRVYRLEHTADLTAGHWVAHPLLAGTGDMITLTEAITSETKRFYRVRRW